MFWVLTNRSRDPILLMHRQHLLDRTRSPGLDAAQLVCETLDLLCVHPSGIYDQVILVVHLLLLGRPSANCFAKGLGVNGGSCGSPSNQWDVIVVTIAFAIQLLDDVSAAGHEPCRFLHQSLFSTLVIDVRFPKKPAHVGLRQLH